MLLAGCSGAAGPGQRSLTLTPTAFTLVVGDTVQLDGMVRDGAGNPVPGAAVNWATSDPAVAQVDGNGLVTGSASGSATISAASESDTATAAITVHGVPCLNQAGPTVTVSGQQSSALYNTTAAVDTKFDASTAQFLAPDDVATRVGGAGLCYHGGQVVGQGPPSTSWTIMHDRYGMVVRDAPFFQIEGVTFFDYGDGVSMDDQRDGGWTIRNVHVKYSRDDCVENDFLNSGMIDSSFFDGCYDGMSSLEYTRALDGSANLVVIRNSLWRLQAMDQAYSGPLPNHNAFWKWSDNAPQLALYGNVFRADAGSEEGNGAGMFMAPPPGKLADCANNVMVWLGPGAFPEQLPTTFDGKVCFTLMTGATGLDYWNNAVAQWKAAHPSALADIGPPIVSLFSPGVTGSAALTGTVSLTATAVDDDSVVAVVFRMTGDSIGTMATAAPLTKYTLTWDSHGEPNGTYALTATARDAAGHATTSAAVTVTVSN
ncbi:MAG TPA: Ig-like domain-containing protein [Gemmatimonadales bacterium]|nr:Ig-like domain-containing protein [Gemmatimonadales bacterium]